MDEDGVSDNGSERDVKPRILEPKLPIPTSGGSTFFANAMGPTIYNTHQSYAQSHLNTFRPPQVSTNTALTVPVPGTTTVGRPRATSAPSPITPNFFSAAHPQPLLGGSHAHPGGTFSAPAAQPSYTFPAMPQSIRPQTAMPTVASHTSNRSFEQTGTTMNQRTNTQYPIQPKLEPNDSMISFSSTQNTSSSNLSDTSMTSESRQQQQQQQQQTDNNKKIQGQRLSVDVPPYSGVPALLPDSHSLPSTAGSNNSLEPATPRTIFNSMLHKSLQGQHHESAERKQPGVVNPPGPTTDYIFPPPHSRNHPQGQGQVHMPATSQQHQQQHISQQQQQLHHVQQQPVAPSQQPQPGGGIHPYFVLQANPAQQNRNGGRVMLPPRQQVGANACSAGPAPGQGLGMPAGIPAGLPLSSHNGGGSVNGPIAVGENNVLPIYRPSPLTNLQAKENRPHWSPPPSAGFATSPTRLLNSTDYDKLFSSAPFGMLFADNQVRKSSRSGSIFGLTRYAPTQ